jgi:hypothetical protein
MLRIHIIKTAEIENNVLAVRNFIKANCMISTTTLSIDARVERSRVRWPCQETQLPIKTLPEGIESETTHEASKILKFASICTSKRMKSIGIESGLSYYWPLWFQQKWFGIAVPQQRADPESRTL